MLLPAATFVALCLLIVAMLLFIQAARQQTPTRTPLFLLVITPLVLLLAVLGGRSEMTSAEETITAPRTSISGVAPVIPVRELTPTQILATLAARDRDDLEIAQKMMRLDATCPEREEGVVKLVLRVKREVLAQSGRSLEIVDVLDRYLSARERAVTKPALWCSKTSDILIAGILEED